MNRVSAQGFSLVEIMVALILALMLVGVLVAVTITVGKSARMQTGVSELQERARFALESITRDLEAAAAAPSCLNYAVADGAKPEGAEAHVDQRTPLRVHFQASAAPLHLGWPGDTPPYAVDPAQSIFGIECDRTACSPPESTHPYLAASGLPGVGLNSGDRAPLGDALVLRILDGNGVPATVVSGGDDGQPAELQTTEALATGLTAILVTDCASSSVYQAVASNGAYRLSGNHDDDEVAGLDLGRVSLYDLSRNMELVTYYLAVNHNSSAPGSSEVVLHRRGSRGDVALVPGVERLDFLYHVESADGTTSVLRADEMQNWSSCRPLFQGSSSSGGSCSWRSIKGVEVFLLTASDAAAVASEAEAATGYRYAFDEHGNRAAGDYASISDGKLPTGAALDRRVRREFRTFVALRGLNP